MKFPLEIAANINTHEGTVSRSIKLNSELTFIVGPNGSGKTHLLKGLKNSFSQHTKKKVRFISAGRLAPLEEYRSNYDQFDRSKKSDEANHGGWNISKYRHNIENINADFHTLAERQDILIKVRERLQKLFKRNIYTDWNQGNLRISFSKSVEYNTYYSSGREASGLLHLVGILSALYDDEVGVLLIDEPEVSLHPHLQAFLLKEISRVAGIPSDDNYQKIIVMATHSTEMIRLSKADDLLSFIFCNDLKEDPMQIPSDAGELKNQKIKGLIARLGQEHKLTLFSKTPLLVEGPSDVIICNSLSDKLYLNLEAAGSQILPINGKESMPETVKLLRLMGKKPTILVDADAFADGLDLINSFFNDKKTKEFANSLDSMKSHSDILTLSKEIYDEFCNLVEKCWSNIERYATQHFYFTYSEDDIKNKRRAALCAVFTNNEIPREWLKIKDRLNALFAIFNECGIFILKKGSIESYYTSEELNLSNKVNSSVEESENIYNLGESEINSSYQEIIDCLRYASNSEIIDESRAIRDELLTTISAAHARYADGEINFDILMKPESIFSCVIENNKLKISLNSKVLDVDGFPIYLSKDDDVRRIVNSKLGIS